MRRTRQGPAAGPGSHRWHSGAPAKYVQVISPSRSPALPRPRLVRLLLVSAVLAVATTPSLARAGAVDRSSSCLTGGSLAANDDGSTGQLAIGQTINFFG